MNPTFRLAASLALCSLSLAPALAQGGIATLRATRYASLRDGSKASAVQSGQSAPAGATLVTGRRSAAEASLKGATLRLAERTEVVLSDPEAVQLQSGALFVKGTLRVNTEGAAALLKDGTATVEVLSPGITRVSALSGSVEVEQDEARVALKPGESITFERVTTRRRRGTPEPIPSADRPEEAGGSLRGWWHQLDDEDGLMVFPGSRSAYALRIDPITEAIGDIAAIPPAAQSAAESADRRQELLAIAAARITPTLDEALAADPQLTLAKYRTNFAADYIEDRFPRLSRSDRDFLRANGMRTVDQLFAGLSASGGGFGPGLQLLKNEHRIFDRNADKTGYFLGGALAALATGGGVRWSAPRPSAMGYGFLSDPQGFGGRAELVGTAGKTRLHIEANTLSLSGGSQNPSSGSALSQAVVEKELSGGLSVFAGRKRFYAGPVLQNAVRGQLLADRYTGVGIRRQSGNATLEAAFLTDANPERRGSQSGFLASLTTRSGGGLMGFHVLNAAKVSGGGTGTTFSMSQPMGAFDGYGEVGRSLEGRTVATVGVYLASLFQKTGVDAWIEGGTHEGYANSLTLGLAKTQNALTLRAFGSLNQPKGRGSNGKWGFGAIWRYN